MASRHNRQHLESWLVVVAPLLLLTGYAVVPVVFSGRPHILGVARLICVGLAGISLCVALVSAMGGSRRSKERHKSDIPLSSLETILVLPSRDDPPSMPHVSGDGDTTLLVLESPQRKPAKLVRKETANNATDEEISLSATLDPAQCTLEQLKQLSTQMFVEACGTVYMERGFIVAPGPQASFGRILALRSQAAEDISWAICRPNGSGPVEPASILQLAASMAEHRITKAFVMAVDGFSEDARAAATFNRITLINADMLLIMVRKLTPTRFSQVVARAGRQ